MKQIKVFFLLIVPLIISAQQQDDVFQSKLIIKAYTLNSPALFDKAIENIKADLEVSENKAEKHLALAYANYGLAGTCIGANKKSKGNKAAEQGIKYAKLIIDHADFKSEAHALLSGLYGIKIAFSPMKGMYLGPKSDKHVKKAIELNGNNGFAHLQKGSSYYNTPRMFGGDVNKSIDSFKKAIALFSDKELRNYAWKLEAMTWLGQAYAKTGQTEKAKSIYNEILTLEPDFGWVKDILLPNL